VQHTWRRFILVETKKPVISKRDIAPPIIPIPPALERLATPAKIDIPGGQALVQPPIPKIVIPAMLLDMAKAAEGDLAAIARVMAQYAELGKVPPDLRKEMIKGIEGLASIVSDENVATLKERGGRPRPSKPGTYLTYPDPQECEAAYHKAYIEARQIRPRPPQVLVGEKMEPVPLPERTLRRHLVFHKLPWPPF
jgi:hypothetical protein